MKNRIIMTLILTSLLSLITLGCVYKTKEVKINSNVDLNVSERGLLLPMINTLSEENPPENENNNLIYLGEFLLTGYCDCPICQEEWVGTTALGVPPTTEWTVAVDPDVIPLGSMIWIDGFDHAFRAEDVGAAIQEKHIDVFCSSHEECYSDFCNGYADVYLIVE